MAFQKILACLLAFFTGVWWNIYGFFNNFVNDYTFSADTSELGDVLPNVKSNLNNFSGRFPEHPQRNDEYDPFEFVDYIQLMECSGGNSTRDLFRDPDDFTVIDDYDFTALISSCRGILSVGAKPLLKLGNVPSKLSRRTLEEVGVDTGSFDVNVYPPDDYGEYCDYIKAIAGALIDEFGAEEVRTWRFGVLTEYENADWFRAPSGDPEETAAAYCKLYDYTVQALIDTIGEDVFVGAHSMTCSEGLWDEKEFIRHCASGENYANGGTGTRLCYLSSSYYEVSPGERGGTKSIAEIVNELKGTAEAEGLTGLICGVDEGRILVGLNSGRDSNELLSRTVGYTYQAAFDASLIKQMFDSGMDYFSSWEYCSEGGNHGLPLVSYFVAKYASVYEGSRLVPVEKTKSGLIPDAEVEASAAYNEDTGVLRVMAYNYKNKLAYHSSADVTVNVNAPQLPDGRVKITAYTVNDDCNWFDEWVKDREELGITNEDYSWSPDDGCCSWANSEARETFLSLADKYSELCRPLAEDSFAEVKDGRLTLKAGLDPHAVIFWEISPAG